MDLMVTVALSRIVISQGWGGSMFVTAIHTLN
jgi:hypothetical protein